MFAVAGRWRLDPAMADQQRAALPRIVDGVKGAPGFVRGFWARDLDGPGTNLTYIVFETLQQAERFRGSVEANAPAQQDSGVERDELRILEVLADA